MNLKEELSKILKGDVLDDETTLALYSRDGSICEVRPQVIVCPKDVEDIKTLVNYVRKIKSENPLSNLSITARGAGTDMSGAAINESIILDVSKYIHGIIEFTDSSARVLAGTFYRDFEIETLKRGLLLPSYPASKNLCTVVGMVANNSAGEKTLVYGSTKMYVKEVKVILEDGNEYVLRPFTLRELEEKIKENTFEGGLYRKLFDLLKINSEEIKKAKPLTAKNSAGYFLWDVYNGETFDLSKIISGSQGTLGIITEISFSLVPSVKVARMLAMYLHDLKRIPEAVNAVLPYKPSSIESFDDATIKLAVKYIPDILRNHHAVEAFRLFVSFIPEFLMYYFYGFPKLVMLVEFGGNDAKALEEQIKNIRLEVKKLKIPAKAVFSEIESKKFWSIRRESYNLLRKHAEGKEVATFIEDVVVPPDKLYEFLPRLNEILHSYDLTYSIAGHAGSGNFHIFPLMDFKDPLLKDKVIEISNKVYDLVAKYGGSITAEHNDGISRTPFLSKIFSPKMISLFEETKQIFDPLNIFNPGKKTHGTVEYFKEHIRKG